MPNSDNKENIANLGLSEEQVMQKAQAQLQHEQGGLKKLPIDRQAGPAPCTPDQSAGAAQSAGFAAAEQFEHVTAAESHAQKNSIATENDKASVSVSDQESSSDLVTPHRATSVELANAEEPVPLPRGQLGKHAQHSSLHVFPEHQPHGNASSVMPHGATSYPNLAADDHRGSAGVTGDQPHERPSKKRRPNMFMQCISCGAK